MFGEDTTASLILLGIFVVLSAFFSSSEAALLSVQRIRIQNMVRNRVPGAARVAKLVEHPHRLLPPILVGNNLVNTAAAALATAVALALFENDNQGVLIATAAVTVVLLIFGETIPKTLAAQHAERFSIIIAIPIVAISWALRPISFVLEGLSNLAITILGGKRSATLVTAEEIKAMITMGREEGAVEHGEAEMIRRVLEFGDRHVREVMTPRPEIVWVEQGTTIRQFLELYNQNYHTRFPVYRGKVDNVVGLVAVKDVMRLLAGGADFEASATRHVRPAMFVPETKRIQELFDEMRTSGEQLAMIADEYGGVAGLVTLKRLVEDIVGRVGGEDEEAPIEVVTVTEGTFELDASILVSEINERLDLGIPQGDYDTLAGFVLEKLGHIPEKGEEFDHANLRFTVAEMQGVRISKVRVETLDEDDDYDDDDDEDDDGDED